MPSFNKVILAGNLTRDPELRYTPKGTAVAKICLAINRAWRDESGQQKEEVTFVEADAFGKTAETISQYLKKGRPILIEGRLKLDQWQDKATNQNRQKLGVVIESFQFLGSNQEDGGSPSREQFQRPAPGRSHIDPNASRRSSSPTPAPASYNNDMPPDGEDDVPF